ncbi:hypothetical protein BMS3Bbin04_01058 [bacterium BMS3Bbin04]|nr:hypothetical protein BMS3Bbin04_01058 [bacterium BMS3Bbin04]
MIYHPNSDTDVRINWSDKLIAFFERCSDTNVRCFGERFVVGVGYIADLIRKSSRDWSGTVRAAIVNEEYAILITHIEQQ